MTSKIFSITAMAALLSMAITACDPSVKNGNGSASLPPPLDEWWKQIESGGEIFGDFRYKSEAGGIRIIRYEGEGGTVTIPAEIERTPVTSIGIHAFRETNLKGVPLIRALKYLIVLDD